ncbi:MAG: hypothetical protein NTU73_08095 [Ignavibacteriae bacterium]|nr:hypothetical protein [Ignavibacteriota bacterium]
MDFNNFKNLFLEVLKFRRAIENCNKNLLPVSLQSFPTGSCGDASLILAHYLKEKRFGEFDYILGGRMGKSHGWLAQGEIIIDITADQFEDNNESVIVTINSKWHDEFNGEKSHIADLNIYDENTRSTLLCAYKEIIKNIINL